MHPSPSRTVPEFPPQGRLRVVIDTDAACEVDDQWAMALALMAPERFDIQGFVSAHVGDRNGRQGVQQSFDDIQLVLHHAGVEGQHRVFKGSHPLVYSDEAQDSEGVDFIIEEAMRSTDDRPLWIVSLGAITNVASALIKQPRIADRVRVLWHGRTQWPHKCWNLNAYNDLKAVRVVFHSRLPLVLFDTGGGLNMPMEESERRIGSRGQLGRFVHDLRFRHPRWQEPGKGIFDLGDIAALLNPDTVQWEVVPAPTVNWDMQYDHGAAHGDIVRVFDIDRERTFDDFESRLSRWALARG